MSAVISLCFILQGILSLSITHLLSSVHSSWVQRFLHFRGSFRFFSLVSLVDLKKCCRICDVFAFVARASNWLTNLFDYSVVTGRIKDEHFDWFTDLHSNDESTTMMKLALWRQLIQILLTRDGGVVLIVSSRIQNELHFRWIFVTRNFLNFTKFASICTLLSLSFGVCVWRNVSLFYFLIILTTLTVSTRLSQLIIMEIKITFIIVDHLKFALHECDLRIK